MPSTVQEVMLTLAAKDEASRVANQIDGSFKSMANNITSSLAYMNSGLDKFGSLSSNVIQGLTGKSAMDNILGTSSRNETNQVLLRNMTETEEAYQSLFKTVDETTDKSLTSMQELIPAMNAFKAATGASDKEMTNITEDMANFGAAVLAQTGSTDLAQGAMMDLSKGIKGAFASLDQYGVSEDALMRTKLWSGKEEDVEGYMAAVTEVIGSTDELMKTNQGLDALIGKTFSRAGKKMGNEFLPIIKDIKKGFIELDDEMGGALAGSILAVGGGIDVLNTGLRNVSTTVQGVKDLAEGFNSIKDAAKNATLMVKNFGKATEAIEMGSNISSIGADVSSVGKSMSGASDLAIDAGISSFSAIDTLKDARIQQKEWKKAEQEVDKLIDRRENLLNNLVNTNDEKLVKKLKKGYASADTKLNVGELSSDALSSLFTLNENTFDDLSKSDWGLSDAIKHNYNDLMDDAGRTIYDSANSFAEKPRKASESLKSSLTSFSSSMKGSFNSFTDSLKTIKTDGISGNFEKIDKKLYQSLKGTSSTVEVLESMGDIGDDAGDAVKSIKEISKVEEATETVVGGASAIGALGPEATAASAEIGATAAATTSLSAAFTSMIVPLLAISAVIIVMIPIVSVIAAEAMVFLKLLGEFMESLNFNDIDLTDSIKGIKSIAEGLAWVGVAMGAMTFASIMTGLAVVTSGFLGMTKPLEIASTALQEASDLLNNFASISIDSSVVTNIKNISNGLKAVSDAMLALTSVTVITGFSDFIAWAFNFKDVTSALEDAKDDISNAASQLQTFSDMDSLDESTAKNIQNVCDSLASVGKAMEALRSMRDSQNWDNLFGDLMNGLFGEGLNIKDALDKVKMDIEEASKSFKNWEGLKEVPEGVGTKIKSVSDALTNVSEAFEILRGLRDDNNWDSWMGGLFGGADIATAITNIGTDLRKVSTRLASLSTIANVNEDVSEKITNINTALGKISEVVKSMTNIPSMEGFNIESVTTAVTNVREAANQLSQLSTITLGEDSTGILGTIQTAMESLKATLSSASGFSTPSMNIGSQIVTGIKSGLSPLTGTISGEVTSATYSSASQGWTGGAKIAESINGGFKSALNLHTTMTTEMDYVKTAVDNGISEAKSAAESGAEDIVQAFRSGINVGSPGDIARTMSGEMKYTLEAIKSSYGDLKGASYNASRTIVDNFGNPSLDLDLANQRANFSSEQIGSLRTVLSQVPEKTSNSNVTIIVAEGAVPIDARNMTKKEAQGIMITALESLDNIANIDVVET